MRLPAFLTSRPPTRYDGQLPRAHLRDQADGPARVCRMVFDEICVLANGDIVCSCGDPAGLRVYGNVFRDRIADVYDGRRYREIRSWQLESPPSAFCPVIGADCGGRVSRASAGDRPRGRHARTLQLEPVSTCNVRCPSCPATVMAHDPAYAPDRRGVLPFAVMEDVVAQLPALEKLLFYNFGEPFLHPEAVRFLRSVRRRRPDVTIHTSTNGLAFRTGVVEAIAGEGLLDRVVFSVDGAREETYGRYRVGGRLGKALASLDALATAVRRAGTRVEVVWQYILFDWNDSDEEIGEARARAAALGVPLSFVVTHTPGASRRFPPGSAALSALVPDSWDAMTCDLKMAEARREGGRAAGRYEARLTSRTASVNGPAGAWRAVYVTVRNPTAHAWPAGRFRIGVRLRDAAGRFVRELPGIAIPPGASKPGGKDTVVLDVLLPGEGRAELYVDVVEERVCWFSERGSAPLVIPVAATAGAAESWPVERVVDLAFARLAGTHAEPADRRFWISRLRTGGYVEELVSALSSAAGAEWPSRRHAFLSALRTLLGQNSGEFSSDWSLISIL
jgi:pyruvate-formate lyase-activating enzyme